MPAVACRIGVGFFLCAFFLRTDFSAKRSGHFIQTLMSEVLLAYI